MTTPFHRGARCRATASLLCIAVMAAALILAGCGRSGGNATEAAVEGPQPMPDFSLASLGGARVTKADFAGKVVLFDFWATWCGPCHLQAEILAEIYPDAAKRGIEFVAVSSGEEASIVRDFVSRKPFPYAVLVDPDEVLAGPLEVMALPTLVVMDARGKITYRHTGVADAESVDAALRAAAGSGA